MTELLARLNKLKGRSLDELRVRGAQALNAYAERSQVARGALRLPTDAALFRLLDETQLGSQTPKTAAGLLEHFRTRTAPKFFAAFDDADATRREFRERFAGEQQLLIHRAERITAGRFDLLGFEELDFGEPVDWHLEPVSGKRTPLVHWSRIDEVDTAVTGDKKIVWELNRHQYFMTLGRAYWLTSDEKYAATFAEHLAGWMDANPPKLGLNWMSSLEVAFRSISWLWALWFFKESEHLTPQLFARALKYLYVHARHLETYLSTYSSPNTHLTGEALGLFYLGTLLPEFRRAARWRKSGRSILVEELSRHVLADGVYFERASYYHRYTTDFYTHFLILSERNGGVEREPLVREKLRALLDHLMHITRPDGTTPLIGDDDGGLLAQLDERAANDFRATLATGAALLGRADYKFVAGEEAAATLWLLGSAGLRDFAQLPSQPPAETSRAFPEGGYYVMRDGWTKESNYLLLDCGAHGVFNCGHAHADALSFELAGRGRTLLVDPGTYTYTGSPELRDFFRSSEAHNTLTIDGESSSVPAGPFSWKRSTHAHALAWKIDERFDYFAGVHDGYMSLLRAPAMHTRSVLFLKDDYWIVRDAVETDGEHRYELHFHFAAGAQAFAAENGIDATGLKV
ncbi:MAG: alginate lyase family protein, partial [Acidobacteria bacterium]|nr:alginate lyase family protein [Acidobacteriota bacterium]